MRRIDPEGAWLVDGGGSGAGDGDGGLWVCFPPQILSPTLLCPIFGFVFLLSHTSFCFDPVRLFSFVA